MLWHAWETTGRGGGQGSQHEREGGREGETERERESLTATRHGTVQCQQEHCARQQKLFTQTPAASNEQMHTRLMHMQQQQQEQ
jgi:hypothetical protein